MQTFYVKPEGSRPDFRLVLAFVWGDDTRCDTDGNSHNPASRDWTELYAQNRARPTELFEVYPTSEEPLVMTVESEHEWLAAAVALLLTESTGGSVSTEFAGKFGASESLYPWLGGFDVPAAWDRFRASPFQRSTLEDPYPNLRG